MYGWEAHNYKKDTYFVSYYSLFNVDINLKLLSTILLKLKIHHVDEIAIKTNVYLYEHYQKTKTLCRHVLRFPSFTASG